MKGRYVNMVAALCMSTAPIFAPYTAFAQNPANDAANVPVAVEPNAVATPQANVATANPTLPTPQLVPNIVNSFIASAVADAALLGAGGDPAKMVHSNLAMPSAFARIKDIAELQGVRENQLVGYGLVIGLNGTGDSLSNSPFTEQSLRAMLDNLGISPPAGASKVANVAAVIVTANMPAFATPGSRMDVSVSSLGDATSLQGGTLVMTPLLGADGETYAVAQGNMIISGFAAQGVAASVTQGVPTAGRIPNGALIERPIQGNYNYENNIVLELRNPDFSTAVRVVDLINIFAQNRYAANIAQERDSKTIVLRKPKDISMTRFIADIEMIPIPTDEVARVVVDERTGTVVIGEKVRVSRVAISHGSLTVEIAETPQVTPLDPFGVAAAVTPQTAVNVNQQTSNLGILGGTDLDSLVKGLNDIGVQPTGIIAILQAIKSAGALHAELVVQ